MANSDLIGSLVRAMDIMKLIGNSPTGMRISDICNAMNLKTPTIYNIVRTLTAGGFIERRGGVLRLGRAFRQLAGVGDEFPLEEAARAELLSLYQRIPKGATIFGIATPQGIEQTHRISLDRPGVIQNLPNEIMHPYATAAGLIGLAFADEESFLLQSEKWPFAEFGAHLWRSRTDLELFLEQIRKCKVAISPFDRDLFWRFSGAVLDGAGKLAAIIGVSIPAAQLTPDWEDVVEKEVRKSAQNLSLALRQQG